MREPRLLACSPAWLAPSRPLGGCLSPAGKRARHRAHAPGSVGDGVARIGYDRRGLVAHTAGLLGRPRERLLDPVAEGGRSLPGLAGDAQHGAPRRVHALPERLLALAAQALQAGARRPRLGREIRTVASRGVAPRLVGVAVQVHPASAVTACLRCTLPLARPVGVSQAQREQRAKTHADQRQGDGFSRMLRPSARVRSMSLPS